jgi:hypothetical protein
MLSDPTDEILVMVLALGGLVVVGFIVGFFGAFLGLLP